MAAAASLEVPAAPDRAGVHADALQPAGDDRGAVAA
jgi:hypothetical protein